MEGYLVLFQVQLPVWMLLHTSIYHVISGNQLLIPLPSCR